MKDYIRTRYPHYYNDRSKIIFLDQKYGETLTDGTIVLPVKFSTGNLECCQDKLDLLNLLIHEYQHANDLQNFNSLEKIIYGYDMYWFQDDHWWNGYDGSKKNRGLWMGRHWEIYQNSAKAVVESYWNVCE